MRVLMAVIIMAVAASVAMAGSGGVVPIAINADMLDGAHGSSYLGATTTAVDSDKLDGQHGAYYATTQSTNPCKLDWKKDIATSTGSEKTEWQKDVATSTGIAKIEWSKDVADSSAIAKTEWIKDVQVATATVDATALNGLPASGYSKIATSTNAVDAVALNGQAAAFYAVATATDAVTTKDFTMSTYETASGTMNVTGYFYIPQRTTFPAGVAEGFMFIYSDHKIYIATETAKNADSFKPLW